MAIEKKILKEGSGQSVEKGNTVKVHCIGTLQNGTKFWSSRDPDQDAYEFKVGEHKVIKGWDEGVVGMKQGEVAVLTVPPEAAYGVHGFAAWGIPPHATLIFELEILSIHAS
jgi:peptidylprolyl isomerase